MTQVRIDNAHTRRYPALGILAVLLTLLSWRLYAIDALQVRVSDLKGAGLSASGISTEINLLDSHHSSIAVHILRVQFAKRLGAFKNVLITCAAPIIKEPSFSCEQADISADSERFGLQSFAARVVWNSKTRDLAVAATDLRVASGSIDAAIRWSPKSWGIDLSAQGIALEPARRLLGDASPLGKDWALTGRLDRLHTRIAGRADIESIDISGTLSATDFGNADGTIAAQQLSTSVDIRARRGTDAWRIDAIANAGQGELLYGRAYWNFQREPAHLQASAAWQDTGVVALGIQRLELGKMLHARGSGVIRLAPNFSLNAMGLDIDDLDIAALPSQTRDGLFAGTITAQIEGQGHIRGRVEIEDAAPASIDLQLDQVHLLDPIARLGVDRLSGHLLWHSAARDAAAQPPDSTRPPDLISQLGWQSANLYGVAVGGATARFITAGADFSLLDAITVPILDGGLAIKTLKLRRAGQPQMSVRFDADIDPISLPPLCKAFGWPEFAGRLSGHIPNLSLDAGEMTLGGILDASVFDGRVSVSGLKLKDALGARPRLQASVRLERLDLAAVTGAFSVGKITGRVDGEIRDLELVGWEPTAFDARLYSTPHDRSKKRISQRAVENISSIGGGGGAAAVLQRGALRFFDDFNYAELGISCKLVNDVCIMGGIEPRHPGYYLVKGSGLPRIQVIGAADRVDWLQLVASLKELPNSHPSIGNAP